MLIWSKCLRWPVDVPAGIIWPQEKQRFSVLGQAFRLLDWTRMFILGIIFSSLCENFFCSVWSNSSPRLVARIWIQGLLKEMLDRICLALSLVSWGISAIFPLLSTLWFLNAFSFQWPVQINSFFSLLNCLTNRLSEVKVKPLLDY